MEIDSDRISATLKNGILTIRLPKIDKNRVKKIRIKAE
jgi:HSP20 family molecular chaperone IbpA